MQTDVLYILNISNGIKVGRLGSGLWVDLGVKAKAKIQLFQKMVMLHIKLKGMAHAAVW